jgi:DNA-binding NtrC family response regulator
MTAIEAAFTYGNADRIRLEDLPLEVRGDGGARAPSTSESRGALAGSVTTFEESERALLQRALDSTQGNKVRAAKMLGISRKQLYAKLKKYAIAARRLTSHRRRPDTPDASAMTAAKWPRRRPSLGSGRCRPLS